ncbi:DUF5010 domain-containing protein [candidate division KSB1 bacterium]|nr:DUF5010 domain-containing protein [candidate division KSB1 bacterium]
MKIRKRLFLLPGFFCLFAFLFDVSTAMPRNDLWCHISLGRQIIPDGIELVQNPDGLWRVTELGGQSCIEMAPNPMSKAAYLYFAVDDNYIFNNASDVFISFDYFDRGLGYISVEFDDGVTPTRHAATIVLTNKNKWIKHSLNLQQIGFTNQQPNGADFRIASSDTSIALLALKNVYVWRAPGAYVAPLHQDFTGETFTENDYLVCTYFFYWYDIYSGAHIWDDAQQTDDALQDHPYTLEDFSFKSVAWHKCELLDMTAAQIDVVLPVYWGSAREMEAWSVEGLQNLVLAEKELIAEGKAPPKIGMFFDTSTLQYGEYVLRAESTPTDLNTAFGRAFFFKHIRDFYSLIPPELWARIDGQPVVWLYAAAFAANANATLVNYVNNHFAASFPTLQPYIVRETSWNLTTANEYAWGAALNGAQISGVAAVGPGYNDSAVPGRTTPVRDREDGDFYDRNCQKVLGSDCHLAVIETWNELHEGTDICHSREYGRQYIDMTTYFAQEFKKSTKFFSFQPQTWTGALQPACSLLVQDRQVGITPATVACACSENSGETWHDCEATCSGSAGTKAVEKITAQQIPFSQGALMSGSTNFVRFSIANTAGDTVVSPAFAVFNGHPPDYAASITLGANPQANGIRQSFHINDDGWSDAAVVGGSPCAYNLLANPSPYPGRYLYFNIADTLVYAGSHPDAWITINYYDTSATGRIELQYDSEGDALSQKYKSGGSVMPANSRQWKQAECHVKNVFFANRQNGMSDFRFYTSGVMFLRLVSVRSTETAGIEKKSNDQGAVLPQQHRLFQNYPNPFNPGTEIRYSLPQAGRVNIKIFDLQGREVITLCNQQQPAGIYSQRWQGVDRLGAAVTSGLYLCRLRINAQTFTRKMLLMR